MKEHSEHRSSRSYRLFAAASILALVSACAEGGSVNQAATAGNETLPAENMAMPMDEASDGLVFGNTASDPGAAPDTNSAGTVSAPAVGENKPEVESVPKAKAEAPHKPPKAESRAALKAEPKRAPQEAAGTSTCAPRSIERWATAKGFRTSLTALPETECPEAGEWLTAKRRPLGF